MAIIQYMADSIPLNAPSTSGIAIWKLICQSASVLKTNVKDQV